MAVEFKQKSAGDIGNMIRRRFWHLVLPTLVGLIAMSWVVSKLPSIYQSRSLLTVKPPVISDKIVSSLSDDDLNQRLLTMNQEVLSRSSLEPMIAKYRLYETERSSGAPMEQIIEKMLKNIEVKADTGEQEKVASFTIKFTDRDPRSAQQVTGELASMYVNSQIETVVNIADTTKDFLDQQVSEVKNTLDVLSKRRLEVMMQNVETLPDNQQGLIAQLAGLRQKEDTLSKDKESLLKEKGRLSDQINGLNQQMRIIENFGAKDADSAGKKTYKDSSAYAEMVKKRAELQAKLESQKKVYKDKMPEVVNTKTELARIEEQIDDMAKDAKESAGQAVEQTKQKADLQKQQIQIDIVKAQSEISQADLQMSGKDSEIRQTGAQISVLEAKINTIPNVKVALEGINNEYNSAKIAYDDVLKKSNESGMQVKVAGNAQGETIKVQDAANLPSTPVNSAKRMMLITAGTGFGLLLGLFLAGIFEVPRLFRIQSIDDAKHYTGLPVLASIPPLLTYQELAWNKRVHWLKVLAGIAAAIGSIPLVAMALQLNRFLERFVS
jgi:polysaccharide biosynthesis transport protein